jgi:hypothetical protein
VSEQTFADLSELFEFEESTMDYYDGPLSGWMRSKQSGEWFAFDCQPIVWQMLWHWTLVAAAERIDVLDTLQTAAAQPTGSWLSVVEDRRPGASTACRMCEMDNAVARPVVSAARARLPGDGWRRAGVEQ